MTVQTQGVVPVWSRGDRLRKARVHAGMTTHELAAAIGVSPKTINNAESDKHEVRKILINAWSMATGVPVEWLQTGITPGTPDGSPGATVLPRLDSNQQPSGYLYAQVRALRSASLTSFERAA